MRDVLVALLLLIGVPVSLLNPVNGVLLFTLVSYLNSHRLTWGFARELPIAFGIAAATIAGFFFYKDDRQFPVTRETLLLIALWILASLGWFASVNPEGFLTEWKRYSKILTMIFFTVCLIKTRQHIRCLILTLAISIGFYALKGGIWGLIGGTESGGLVWGPPGTFFEGNNEMGLVINMVWPLFLALARSEKNPWGRRLFWCLFCVSPLTVILTQSRGAALALFITSIVLFMRVRQKLPLLFLGVAAIFVMIPFIPENWHTRMDTIENFQQDASAMGRINAWHAAWNLAVDRPLTGGGLMAFTPEIIERYAPNPEDFHDVHSIYFEVLGEIGFPGLFTFLALIVATVRRLTAVIRQSRLLPDGELFASYADALVIGLIAYLVNGAFLGLAYFDLFYQYVGLAVSLHVVLVRELEYQQLWSVDDPACDFQVDDPACDFHEKVPAVRPFPYCS